MPLAERQPRDIRHAKCGARRRHQVSVGQRRVAAQRRRCSLRHPFDERARQRAGLLGFRVRIGRQRALAVRGRRAVDRETAAPAAMRGARVVVAPDVRGQRQVSLRVGADQIRRHAQSPEFRRSERFDDLRAGPRRGAPIEEARRLQSTRLVRVTRPPDDAIAAGLVHAGGAARQAEAQVDRRLTRRDPWKRAVPDDAVLRVLVEAEMDEGADEIARLRVSDADRVLDGAGHWIGVPEASALAWRKNDTMSRVAASPTPSTRGSFAV